MSTCFCFFLAGRRRARFVAGSCFGFCALDLDYVLFSSVFKPFNETLATHFSEETYKNLKPLILEQDIPSLQNLSAAPPIRFSPLSLVVAAALVLKKTALAESFSGRILATSAKFRCHAKRLCHSSRSEIPGAYDRASAECSTT